MHGFFIICDSIIFFWDSIYADFLLCVCVPKSTRIHFLWSSLPMYLECSLLLRGECEGCNIQRCLFCLWVCPPPARDKRRNCHVLQRWPDVWPMLCYPLSGVLSTLTPLLRLQRRLPVSPWQLLWLWPGGTAAPSAGFWGWGCCHLCKSTSDTTEMVLRIRSHQQGWNHQRTGGEKQQTWDPF